MKFKNILPLMLTASAFPAVAQLHESINVEGKYVPEIIRVDRVNMFPKPMAFSLNSDPLNYEQTGVAASFTPSLLAMPATGWRSTRYVADSPGYLEFGLGTWLNSTLSAGYRVIDDSKTLAGVRFQHNSSSLWQPKLTEATAHVKQYHYDEALGVYGSHIFDGLGRLDAAIDYHVGIFNYYGFFNPGYSSVAPVEATLAAPGQTLNDFSMRLDWASLVKPASGVNYHATARVRHFAFRALPLPAEWGLHAPKGNRETDVELAAGVSTPWENAGTVGLDASLRILMYGGDKSLFSYSDGMGKDISLSRPENYSMLTLTPYYRFTRGLLDIRLGADIDFTFNAGPDGNRYSLLHIAPDVKFALQTGQVGMYLNILGGSHLNTLANLRQYNYYMMPALTTTRPTYTPLDAALGFNFGPFSGFSIGVEGRFRSSKNVPLGGWYQAWMNFGMNPIPGMDLSGSLTSDSRMLYSLDSEGLDMHGVSAGAYITFNPSRVFSFTARGDVQQQNGKTGFFNGYDRPKITVSAEASVMPTEKLKLTAGFESRAKRGIYTRCVTAVPVSGPVKEESEGQLHRYALPDMATVNLSASYRFTPNFSVWLQGDNILNRRDEILPLLPSQGVSVVGGLNVLF